MAKKKASVREETPEEIPTPVEEAPQVFCAPGDLVGTARPDGGHITRVDSGDVERIEKAAEAVREALATCEDFDSKRAYMAAKWANIVGAVDLRALGEYGPRYYDAVKAIGG